MILSHSEARSHLWSEKFFFISLGNQLSGICWKNWNRQLSRQLYDSFHDWAVRSKRLEFGFREWPRWINCLCPNGIAHVRWSRRKRYPPSGPRRDFINHSICGPTRGELLINGSCSVTWGEAENYPAKHKEAIARISGAERLREWHNVDGSRDPARLVIVKKRAKPRWELLGSIRSFTQRFCGWNFLYDTQQVLPAIVWKLLSYLDRKRQSLFHLNETW